ncbi:MAG: hypothetical protein MJ240_09125 [Kiritimatiellae bacterium]|nr:hypothetical protein [Kiritimatiellia bacterium]
MKTKTLFVALAMLTAGAAAGALTVVENPDGTFALRRNGQAVLPRIAPVVGGLKDLAGARRSTAKTADGGLAWNVWSEEKDGRFRFEIVQRPDGAVEIAILGCGDGQTKSRYRAVEMDLPKKLFNGKPYRMLEGNGRKYQPAQGVFGPKFARFTTRYFVCDGLAFDFNALGPTEYIGAISHCSIRAEGSVLRDRKSGDIKMIHASGFAKSLGGWGGAKLVIREGTFEDYPNLHFFPSYRYAQSFNVGRLVSFGAPKAGKDYAADDGRGWVVGGRPAVKVGRASGAYYSHAVGHGRAVYRFVGLPSGWYVATAQIGNWTGDANAFDLAIGEAKVAAVSVAEKKARTISRAVHVTDGKLDFAFDGDWIVSAVGYTPLLGDQEDFTISRGFWYTTGYEPAWSYHSAFYGQPIRPALRDEEIDMADPVALTAAPRRDPPTPVELPDVDSPALAWTKDTRMWELLGNGAVFDELADDAWRRKCFKEHCDRYKYNAVMFNGMLSRHTYPDARIARGQELIGRFAQDAHELGMKCVDHLDLTLLWNSEVGFRRLIERLPEVIVDKHNNLPSMQLCMNNPEMKRKVFAYLRRDVELGVDGFQLDEGEFWEHGCMCRHCREKFRAETGWQLPLDETDPSVARLTTPLAKRWYEWKCKTITNWYVELRRFLKDLNPNLHLSMYTTHWGFESSHPGRGASSNLLDLGRAINYFGTEIMTRNVMQSSRSLLPHRKMFNVLTRAYGTPIWGWYYSSNQYCNYFAWATANMCGQCALKSDCPPDVDVPDFEAWHAGPHNMRRQGAEAVAEVAVLFSGYSRDWNAGVCFSHEALGLAQELERLHVPYEFIPDVCVTEPALAKYKVLFVGAAECLDDAEIAAIKAFARRGGRVYARPDAGTRDEIGEKREPAAFAAGLADAHSGFATMPPALAFHAEEAMIGRAFAFDPDTAAEAAFSAWLANACRGACVWTVGDLPDRVFTTIWREKTGATVVHFLNATGRDVKVGEKMTPNAPRVPFPALAKDVVFTLPRGKSATAYSPDFGFGGRTLAVKANADGSVTVTLPKEFLKAYTLVRVE